MLHLSKHVAALHSMFDQVCSWMFIFTTVARLFALRNCDSLKRREIQPECTQETTSTASIKPNSHSHIVRLEPDSLRLRSPETCSLIVSAYKLIGPEVQSVGRALPLLTGTQRWTLGLLLLTTVCDSILPTLHCCVFNYTFRHDYGPLVPVPKSQHSSGSSSLRLIECDTDHAVKLYSSRCSLWRKEQMEG